MVAPLVLSLLREQPRGQQCLIARRMLEDVARDLLSAGMMPCDVCNAATAFSAQIEPLERKPEARKRFIGGETLAEALGRKTR